MWCIIDKARGLPRSCSHKMHFCVCPVFLIVGQHNYAGQMLLFLDVFLTAAFLKSLPKHYNSVIIYSLSCHHKPI